MRAGSTAIRSASHVAGSVPGYRDPTLVPIVRSLASRSRRFTSPKRSWIRPASADTSCHAPPPRSRHRRRSCRRRHGGARPSARSQFASAEIQTVVDAGLMGPSVEAFRPDDPLTASELAVVVASLGGAISVGDPTHPSAFASSTPVSCRSPGFVRRPDDPARGARRRSLAAPVARHRDGRPHARVSASTIRGARTSSSSRSPQPVTRAEAAYSFAKYLTLSGAQVESARTPATPSRFPR